jgi:hypothetical protein
VPPKKMAPAVGSWVSWVPGPKSIACGPLAWAAVVKLYPCWSRRKRRSTVRHGLAVPITAQRWVACRWADWHASEDYLRARRIHSEANPMRTSG